MTMRRWIACNGQIKLTTLHVGQILDSLNHVKLISLNIAHRKLYFDIGATDRITPDLQELHLADEYHGSDKLQVGNGTNIPMSHIGSSSL